MSRVPAVTSALVNSRVVEEPTTVMVMAVVVFKGWLSNDQAHQVQEALVGFILSSATSATAGEKFVPRGEEVSGSESLDGQ